MRRPPNAAAADRYTLADWGALVAAIDAPPTAYDAIHASAAKKTKASPYWDLNTGWARTRDYAGAAGWPEGAAKIRSYTDRWIPRLASLVSLPTYSPDLTGEFFDVGVLMSGEPEHWYAPEVSDTAISGAGVVHRVVVNLSASSCIDAPELVRRGAAVAALVAVLEATGAAVEVVVCAVIAAPGDSSRTCDISLVLKQSSDALDLDRLALVAVHPAGLRRIWFRLWESLLTDEQRDAYDVRLNGGYGQPADRPTDERGDVYSPAMSRNAGAFITDAGAELWVMEQLRQLGAIQ